MARPLRIDRVGCWYHVGSRGNERRDIFRDDRDRQHFLELLGGANSLFALRLHAFVLMSNHYHLLVELTEPNLSRSIQWLNVSYSVWFNRRHERSGHLFQGRFNSVVVEKESWGLPVSRYLHLNPVRLGRLGLGKSQVQRSRSIGTEDLSLAVVRQRIEVLRRYRWSSYRAYIGAATVPSWLETQSVLSLGGKSNKPKDQYRQYCEEAIRQGQAESPWEKVVNQAVLGSERFIAQISGGLKNKTEGIGLKRRPTLEELIVAVEKVLGRKWVEFRDDYGDCGRDLVLYLGRIRCGLSFRQLSERADIKYSSSAAAVQRFSRKVKTDQDLARLVHRVNKQMHNA